MGPPGHLIEHRMKAAWKSSPVRCLSSLSVPALGATKDGSSLSPWLSHRAWKKASLRSRPRAGMSIKTWSGTSPLMSPSKAPTPLAVGGKDLGRA